MGAASQAGSLHRQWDLLTRTLSVYVTAADDLGTDTASGNDQYSEGM